MAVTYHFSLRKNKIRANGEAPIYFRITANRKSKYISTGIYIKPKYWNNDKEEVRRSHRNYKSLNSILEREKDKARKVQDELGRHGKDSAKAIKERLKQKQTGDFFDLAETYKQELKEADRHWAVDKTNTLLNKLEAFEGSRSVPLKQIDTEYLERFERFLKRKYNNRSTTINKNFEPVKAIIKKALKKHLISIDPFANFEGAKRGKAEPKTKLSINQIQAIEKLELKENSKLWHTRNCFIFSFYSGGIRFGDLCCLKWEDIKGDRLSYQMNKNEKVFTVELNEHQKKILNLYNDEKKEDNFIFPFLNNHTDYSDRSFLKDQISSQNSMFNKRLGTIIEKVNKKIKKRDLDIPKLENISSHVARHSFAQYAVESGLSIYEVMQTLRHSNIETTQKYLKSLDEQLADKAMKKVF